MQRPISSVFYVLCSVFNIAFSLLAYNVPVDVAVSYIDTMIIIVSFY